MTGWEQVSTARLVLSAPTHRDVDELHALFAARRAHDGRVVPSWQVPDRRRRGPAATLDR